jgi:hypothetical protein
MLRRAAFTKPRPAYTLLEVLLAASIGVMLLAALYVAVDVQVRHAQIGRNVVEQSTLARALLTRMTNDIMPSLGPTDPSRFRTTSGQSSGGGSGGASGTGSGSGGTGSSGTGPGASSSSGSGTSASGGSSTANSTTSSSSGSSTSSSNSSSSSTYNFTVQGDTGQVTLYISRVPRELNVSPDQQAPLVSDLRRITYWLAGGGTPIGLARQELTMVTSDDATALPPDIPDEASLVIAEEVKSLTFSYWDGTNWQDTWDGTQTGSDGQTPIGPPLAIAIVIGLAPPGSSADSQPALKYYRQVVPLPTANGATQQSNTGDSSQ